MKTSLLSLLVFSSLAHATPPVLSLTQVALQKIDPEIKPDHYDIARADLDGDGKEDVLALMNDNSPITLKTNGLVTGANVADINADGSPEVYVFTKDSAKHAGLAAYSANKKKSLSQIDLPELGEHAKGYRGGDEFAVVEGILARRFPIYPMDASKTEPTGKIRQIQYKLHVGEAGWLLKPDKVIEF